MITDKFSPARMWALTKHSYIENRRNLYMTLGVLFGAMILMALLVSKMNNGVSNYNHYQRTSVMWAMMIWISAIGSVVLGSITFSNLNSKAKRINALMLPAAQSEKFVSSCLIYVVGGNIALILSMFVADIFSSLCFGMRLGFVTIFKDVFGPGVPTQAAIIGILAACWIFAFGQALYVVGSALWPRRSFIKTFVALMGFQLVFMIVIPVVTAADIFRELGLWFELYGNSYTFAWICIIVGYTIIAAIYFGAWAIFKRTQVIQRFKMK